MPRKSPKAGKALGPLVSGGSVKLSKKDLPSKKEKLNVSPIKQASFDSERPNSYKKK